MSRGCRRRGSRPRRTSSQGSPSAIRRERSCSSRSGTPPTASKEAWRWTASRKARTARSAPRRSGCGSAAPPRPTGTEAQACLLAGWLRSRLGHDVEREHEPSDRLVGVDVDGEPTPFPPGDPPKPSDLLSDELERFSRDRIYEDAARAAV